VQTAIGINANDLTSQIEKMQVIMNMMQESLAKLDSGFEPQLFDVESEIQPKEQSKPATIQERIAESSASKNYTSLKEAIQQIEKDYIKQSDFDIMKLPYIQEVIDNPNRENAEKLIDYYSRVLVKLNKMNPSKY
jgi:hypothetical protein